MRHLIPTMIILLAVCLPAARGQFAGGTGDPGDPYLIADPNHLFALAADPNHYDKHFKLTADLDLDPNRTGRPPFTTAIIAPDLDPNSSSYQGTRFIGTFDGDGYAILNVTIDTQGLGNVYLGLFGMIGRDSMVQNLGLVDLYLTAGNDAKRLGTLCGDSLYGPVSNCYSTGAVQTAGYLYLLGGLCGSNEFGTISNCFWNTQTSGMSNGVGFNHSGEVSNVFGRTTFMMKRKSTFTDPCTNWDFVGESDHGTWRLCIDGTNYPHLAWEVTSGDLLCPDGVTLSNL